MTDEPLAPPVPTSESQDAVRARRPNLPVVTWMLAGLPVLVCLVAAAPHAQALRQARGFLSGVQLSPGEQERFQEWNRTLVLRDIGIPEVVPVRSIEHRPVAEEDDPNVVIAVATTFELAVAPAGDALVETVIGRFEDNGFRRDGDTLKRRGVTVSFRPGHQSPSIEVHRDW